MTDAAFISFVKSALRSKSRFWRPISEVLKKAKLARGLYRCNICQQEVPVSHVVNGKRRKFVQVDHIKPVVSETGFTDWNQFVENLFCEEDNLQVICSTCHDIKSQQERVKRPSKKKEDNEETV